MYQQTRVAIGLVILGVLVVVAGVGRVLLRGRTAARASPSGDRRAARMIICCGITAAVLVTIGIFLVNSR
jgi:hypothetical protein